MDFTTMDNLLNYVTAFFVTVFCVNSSIAHVKLINPEGGEVFSTGEVLIISWEQEQAHVTIDWELYFSPDGGETWQEIATLDVDQREYQWKVPDVETEAGKIRVVQDNEGMDYIDISENFGIANMQIVTALDDSTDTVPTERFSNFPNPFQSVTNIIFTLSHQNHVSVEIYNIRGAKVVTLMDEALSPGKYIISWNAAGTEPGLFTVLVRADTFFETRKLIKL